MNMYFDLSAFKDTLRSWVDCETPSGDERRLRDFSSLVFHALEKTGSDVKAYNLPGGPLLHAVYGTGQKRCVLMGHMDTVFPYGEAEKYDEENGRLYGAGVLDMKSGLIMLVKIFECISQQLPKGWRIEALLNSDEERGSVASREMLLEALNGASLVFSFEGSPENLITVSRKGILTFQIIAKGVAAHTSGGADKRKNAIYLLSRLVNEIYETNFAENVSVNIGVIEGGKAINIIPDRAHVKGEIRAKTEYELAETERKIKEIAENEKCDYARISLRPPMPPNDKTMRLFKMMREIDSGLAARSAGGGGDAAFACLSGAYTIDGMGAEGARAHTRREYVTEESIERKFLLSLKAILKSMNEYETWL